MADEDLKALIGDKPTKESAPKEEKKEPEKAPESSPEDLERAKRTEELANLDKAKKEALDELQRIRKEAKKAKSAPEEDDDLPKINDEDPSSKAWTRRINDTISPVQKELDKEKQEIFEFSLQEFLKDRPSLSKSPEKLKAVVATYERIKVSSGRTREGVLLDLDKAYAAEHYEELISAVRQSRVESAKADELFARPAVSRGSTSYQNPKPDKKVYSDEERDIIRDWEKHGAPKVE